MKKEQYKLIVAIEDEPAVIECTYNDGSKTYYKTWPLTAAEANDLECYTSDDLCGHLRSDGGEECKQLAHIADRLPNAVCAFNADPFEASDNWEVVVLQIAKYGYRLDPNPIPAQLDIEDDDAKNWDFYISQKWNEQRMTFAIPK